jgi:hypothetical protein
MKGYPLLATIGLALGAFVVYAYFRARRTRPQVDLLRVFEEVQEMLSAARATAEAQAVPVFAMALTGLLAYMSFLGASLVRLAERPAMQVLVGVSAAAVLAGHLLLAFQPADRERRQNRPMFLLMLAFCLVSVSFASFGLYGTVVAGDLTGLETAAWQDYYRDSRTIVVTQTSALRSAAAAHYADANAKLLVFQNQVYSARLENRPFLESPEQAALAPAEKRAADWQRSLVEFPLPPPAPALDRQKAEADLADCVEAINRLAAGAPPPLALRGVQIGRYVAASTEPFARALEALKRREPPAMYSIAICAALEVFPLAALLMLRRRGYLRELIEGIGQSIVMVRRVLRRSWHQGGAGAIAEESQAILVVFRPEVHPGVRFEWNRQHPLAQSTFADVYDAILPDIESKLSAAGYHLALFVNADRMYLKYDLPVLSQLNGGVLVALCERVHPNT